MLKNGLRFFLFSLGVLVAFAVFTNLWVVISTADQVVKTADLAPEGRTALILGTSYNTTEGTSNPFFTARIATAVELYKNNIVNDFILSGSATQYYNEPKAMAKSLEQAAVPTNILHFDTLGVRTLASIVRCKEVYDKQKIIIVTQKFHTYRALFISNYYGLEAIAVPTVGIKSKGKLGILLREILARPLAVLDLYILNRQP